MGYKFSSLFSAIALTSAFDESIMHQASHGRVANVFVKACALEYAQPANEKTGVKAQALTVPETKAGFDKFSKGFIGCIKLGTGKAKAYPLTVKQGIALIPALAAIREGLGLPTVDMGAAWVIVPKVKATTPQAGATEATTPQAGATEATTPQAGATEGTTPQAGTTEGTTPQAGTTEGTDSTALGLMSEGTEEKPQGFAPFVTDFLLQIAEGNLTIAELQAVIDACTLQANVEGYSIA